MEKYYFKTTGGLNDTCSERCSVQNNGVMIGSIVCHICEFCEGHEFPNKFTGSVSWIKCSKLDQAIQP